MKRRGLLFQLSPAVVLLLVCLGLSGQYAALLIALVIVSVIGSVAPVRRMRVADNALQNRDSFSGLKLRHQTLQMSVFR